MIEIKLNYAKIEYKICRKSKKIINGLKYSKNKLKNVLLIAIIINERDGNNGNN